MCPRRSASRGLQVLVYLLLAFTLSGCSYVRYVWNHFSLEHAFEKRPSAAAELQLNIADMYLLRGEVTFTKEYSGPILLAVVTDEFEAREILSTRVLQPPVKRYEAFVLEGTYDLCFFADNGKGSFEASDMIGRKTVTVTKAAVKDDLTFEGPACLLDPDKRIKSDLSIQVAVDWTSYIIDSLDNGLFESKYCEMGFEEPAKFMVRIQNRFFALEKFDPNKTAVLFVHGVNGTPRDFKYLVDGLDTKRFQPWFFYYPSSLPLQKLSSLLADYVGYKDGSYDSPLIVVAHSMGGLVALSALNGLCADGKPPSYLKGYISFDAPYGGVEDAESGTCLPIPVASWVDISPGSGFLEALYKGKATTSIPFYLFFGYETGESSDGEIDLSSQLDHRVHLNASKSYGFNTTHEGILNDKQSRKQFLEILDVLSKR